MTHKKYQYEDLSKRKSISTCTLNDFTTFPATYSNMVVFESGHKSYCEPGWHTRLRVYDHYLIHYILSGKGTYYPPSGTYPVKKGDLFLISPDEAIHYLADLDDPWTYYWFGFNGNEAFNIMKLCGFSDTSPVLHHGDDPQLVNLLHKLAYPECSGLSREYELLGYLYKVFSLFIEKHPQVIISNKEQYLSHAVEYIQLRYSDSDLTVNDIANYVGIDRTYLYRIFNDFFNQSVQDYLQQFRLNKASSLLMFSNASIELVASSCGFENAAYFSTVFKKHFLISPFQYRKQQRLQNNSYGTKRSQAN